jgi:hypothetical protein
MPVCLDILLPHDQVLDSDGTVGATDVVLLVGSCKGVLPAEGKVTSGAERVLTGGVEGEAPDDLDGGGVKDLGVEELL